VSRGAGGDFGLKPDRLESYSGAIGPESEMVSAGIASFEIEPEALARMGSIRNVK